jgi:hypothetical protein
MGIMNCGGGAMQFEGDAEWVSGIRLAGSWRIKIDYWP